MNLPDPDADPRPNPHPHPHPHPKPSFDSETAAVERLLASFAPRPARIDRDRLLFLAGQASAMAIPAEVIAAVVPTSERAPTVTSRTPWYWPASTVAASLMASVLAVLLVVRTDSTSRLAPSRDMAPGGPVTQGPGPKPVEAPATSIPPIAQPQVERALAELPAGSFLLLREMALDHGVESLPLPHAGSGRNETPTTYVNALQSAIERPNALSMGLRY